MNVSGISVKEIMEAIEERIPFGRKVVTLLLSLTVIAIFVWIVEFLYRDVLSPMVGTVYGWVKAGRIQVRLGDMGLFVLEIFIGIAIYVGGSYLVKRMETTFLLIKPVLLGLDEKVDLLEKRVTVLESVEHDDVSTDT